MLESAAMRRRTCYAVSALAIACSFSWGGFVRAEWPQWRGPNRDDVSKETGLLKAWPQGGPPRMWVVEKCGLGYSGPAIVGDRLYTLGARGDTEYLLAIDVSKGQEIWAKQIGQKLGNNWGDGPRSTPSVDGDRVYALGAKGELICADAKSGNVVWKKSLERDLGGKIPTWGYCESPLVYKDKVICTPGGASGSIAALDKNTGEVAWQAKELNSGAHYASAVLRECPEGMECVQLLPDQVVGVEAETGKKLWSSPWPNPTAAIPTPVVRDNLVYVTSGYGTGCKLLEIGPNHAVKVRYDFIDNKEMKNTHGGVVLVGDHIYGHSDGIGWVCQELETGDSVWRERRKLEMGGVTYADGMLYCLGEDSGDVVLVEASPGGWKEHGRFKLDPQTDQRKPSGKIWTHPVVSDGRLYLRDQNLLFCYDVRARSEKAVAAGN
jgi:outer membrane protein assembly factor BamB